MESLSYPETMPNWKVFAIITLKICPYTWAWSLGGNMAAQEFRKWALRSSFVGYGVNKALRED
jgi:hypothetical protein